MRVMSKIVLSSALLAWPSLSAWADNFNLDGIDIDAQPSITRIILHTGSIVPVRKVQVSDTKLVLDIDQVNTEETIQTHFLNGDNISHVILQPLNDHQIRLIIRGENLAAPTIAFGDGSTPTSQSSTTGNLQTSNTTTGINSTLNTGTKSSLSAASSSGQPRPSTESFSLNPEPQQTQNIIQPTESATPKNEESLPFPTSTKQNTSVQTPSQSTTTPPFLKSSIDSKSFPSFPFRMKYLLSLIGGGIALVILGFIVWLGYRRHQFKKSPLEFDEFSMPANADKPVSFRELAQSYRQKSPIVQDPDFPELPELDTPTPSRKTSTEDLVGLRAFLEEKALSDRIRLPEPPLTNTPGKTARNSQPLNRLNQQHNKRGSLDELQLSDIAFNPKPLNPSAQNRAPQNLTPQKPPLNQALAAQYQKSNPKNNPSNNLTNNPKAPLQQPTQPSNSPLQRPLTPKVTVPTFPAAASASKAAPKRNNSVAPQKTSLPSNPEVLNFLRNVAELMEKDGKTEMAQNIHKNLQPKNSG